MRKLIIYLIGAFFIGICLPARAQQPTKEDLEKQRVQIQQEIEELKKSQGEVKKNKKESLGQLARIQSLIRKRDAVIETINKQMRLIDDDIFTNNREIYRLQKDLDTLKAQYAKTVEYAYKNRSNYDMLNFLFSAVSFNDAIKRMEYLKSYREYRERKVQDIYSTQTLLAQKNQSLAQNKTLKTKTLTEQSVQMKKLEEEKKEKDDVVAKLKSRENELSKELVAKNKVEKSLKNSISAIIKREIKEAEERDRKEAALAKANASKTTKSASASTTTTKKPREESKLENTPEVTAVSVGFENNRRKLPWPVDKANITGKFGRHPIEGMVNVTEDNIGVYMQTNIGANVKVVYEGTVLSVHDVGGTAAVTVRHGKYLTTYYNLTSVSVNKDDQVKLGQSLGKAAESDSEDGVGEILFVVTVVVGNNPKYLNPEDWIKPR